MLVVKDQIGAGKESARDFAVSYNNTHYESKGYNVIETFAIENDLDKCKEIVNAKYDLADFQVDYIDKH